jgi:GntR family transcriptional regulator, phosphonate transport system regulatory protein
MEGTIRRAGGIAVWRQVADRLRDMIDGGVFSDSQRLPSESELALRFGINRHTVRAAIADLVREGLLRSEQGRGTFVAAQDRLSYPIGRRTRFSEGLDGQASDLKTLVLDETREPASARLAALLGLDEGAELVRLDTIGFADQMPVSVATHWFEAVGFPEIGALLRATGSISKSFEAVGMADYVRASTRITARRASSRDAEALRLAEGAPVLMVEAVNAHDGRPIQVSRSRFAADRIELTVGDR